MTFETGAYTYYGDFLENPWANDVETLKPHLTRVFLITFSEPVFMTNCKAQDIPT